MSSKNIEKLYEYISENKAKNYPINNSSIAEGTDYIKKLYLKMLAVVIQAGNEIKEGQTMLFERLVAGAGGEESVQDYYKEALEIETEDFDNFCKEFNKSDVKYRFAVDGMLMAILGENDENALELVSGIMEALGINKKEVEYLSALCRSIACQGDDEYEEAEKIRPEEIDCRLFMEYTGAYRTVLCNNESEFKAGAGYKKKAEVSELAEKDNDSNYTLSSKRVYLKNLIVNVKDQCIAFSNNDCVEITGCEFLNGEKKLYFNNCKKVVFKECSFKKFTDRTIWLNSVHEVVIDDCMFENCEYNYNYNQHIYGGVISGNKIEEISIKNSKFIKCGIRNKSSDRYYKALNAISNIDGIIVENCYFEKCMAYYYETTKYTDTRLFEYNCSNINNEIIDSLQF